MAAFPFKFLECCVSWLIDREIFSNIHKKIFTKSYNSLRTKRWKRYLSLLRFGCAFRSWLMVCDSNLFYALDQSGLGGLATFRLNTCLLFRNRNLHYSSFLTITNLDLWVRKLFYHIVFNNCLISSRCLYLTLTWLCISILLCFFVV